MAEVIQFIAVLPLLLIALGLSIGTAIIIYKATVDLWKEV